MLMEI